MSMSMLTLVTTRRMFARMAALGALVLVLGALMAIPASAFDRQDAVVLSNRMIDDCFKSGGVPDAMADEDSVFVVCATVKGGQWCNLWPNPQCGFLPNDHGTHGPIPNDDGVLDGKSARQVAGATLVDDDRVNGHKQHKHRHHHSRRR